MKKTCIGLCLLASFIAFAGCSNAKKGTADNEVVPGIPVKNTVTLVDLGATDCIPCKMMFPVLDAVKKEYKGKVKVIFINVREQDNIRKAKAFKIMAIPTQIFFDKNGKEVYRHTGFLDKKSVTAQLDPLVGG